MKPFFFLLPLLVVGHLFNDSATAGVSVLLRSCVTENGVAAGNSTKFNSFFLFFFCYLIQCLIFPHYWPSYNSRSDRRQTHQARLAWFSAHHQNTKPTDNQQLLFHTSIYRINVWVSQGFVHLLCAIIRTYVPYVVVVVVVIVDRDKHYGMATVKLYTIHTHIRYKYECSQPNKFRDL